MSLQIRERFSLHDWDAMYEFLANMYRPDLALRARRYFEWQFASGGDGDLTVLNAWDGRRLIGILGYVGIGVRWGSPAPLDGAYVLNWIADPEYRGGTAIGFLRWIEKRAAVVIGCDTSEQTNRIVPRLGWKLFEELPRCIAVLDSPRAARLAMPGWSPAQIEKLALDDAREPCSTWSPLESGAAFAPAWSEYPATAFGALRSEGFLRRRYGLHPAFSYRVVATGDPRTCAVCAYRIETAKDDPGVKVARIVEFFHPAGDGERAGLRLLRALAALWRDEGCAYADSVMSSAAFARTMLAAGWTSDVPSQPMLPIRLQPIERAPYRYGALYAAARGLPRPGLEEMYLTKGDGDADRPATLEAVRESRDGARKEGVR